MSALSSIGFEAPLLLWGLIGLPLIWLLLRVIPPAPLMKRFPAIVLLLGLKDPESEKNRTPIWLLLLRSLAIAALIFGFSGPILNAEKTIQNTSPLVIFFENSWASAVNWQMRVDRAENLIKSAKGSGKAVALLPLADLEGETDIIFEPAENALAKLSGLSPKPWRPDREKAAELSQTQDAQMIWLADGIKAKGDDELSRVIGKNGYLVSEDFRSPFIREVSLQDELIRVLVDNTTEATRINAIGTDPSSVEYVLAQRPTEEGVAVFDLPLELRNRLQRFEIEGVDHVGAVYLTGRQLKRPKVGLYAQLTVNEASKLAQPLHYVRAAFETFADHVEADLSVLIEASPDIIVLADIGQFTPSQSEALANWVEEGGILIRFAGPQMAAATAIETASDPFLPVPLRYGSRNLGGALTWEEPKKLAPFDEESLFANLTIPDDVVIYTQLVAQPAAGLESKVLSRLTDGTPLITTEQRGLGRLVFFHVAADASWSNLPISGLFVELLKRLSEVSDHATDFTDQMREDVFQPIIVLDGYGQISPATELPSHKGADLENPEFGSELRPGLYQSASNLLSLQMIKPDTVIEPLSVSLPRETYEGSQAEPIGHYFLLLALGLFTLDVMASLLISGRLLALGAALLWIGVSDHAKAQEAPFAEMTVLAYVKTGDAETDRISEAGLQGLGVYLEARTSVDPDPPVGVDLERDDLSFYPVLYWPISPDAARLSPETALKVNQYMAHGGLILFDTRDADLVLGRDTKEREALQRVTENLTLPAIEPLPKNHVLQRSFYLLEETPGRYDTGEVWVEIATGVSSNPAEMLKNTNDAVTPLIIGSNDWASAWAIKENGAPLFPVGRGLSGEKQRELAYRFGINLVMYALTGNYKSDQIHIPAQLERLK